MEKKIKLSVAIITFNEERNIARCIESVKDLADEILILDSFSTDRTEEICRHYAPLVRFAQHKFDGHIQQKNRALQMATFDVVLSLDADEALGPELYEEIKQAKDEWHERGYTGYSFNRRTHYVDQWIYHCGWYPDTKLRLIDRRVFAWTGSNPHDIIKEKDGNNGSNGSKSKECWLKGDLYHYSYDSIADHITQTNKFTSIAARAAFAEGKRSSLLKIFTRPLLKFFKDYFLKRGFLDGRYGFIICFINALSALLKYAKLWDLAEGKDITLKQNK